MSDINEILEYQDSDDLNNVDARGIVVYSRDWTIDTILKQIELGNIDLNPSFQRRNAWDDDKRSKLIESIMMEYPIPELVLAEDKQKRKSFLVIDGKQRLLTIAGFKYHNKYQYWKQPKLKDLSVLKDLKGYCYDDIIAHPDLQRTFENSSLRCTVINNYKDDQVLYDIFYRLNAGSSPLATQELRQVLNRGQYADFLIDITNNGDTLIQKVMKPNTPDPRLRDVEVVLRLMSFVKFAKSYKGNLKYFLDTTMSDFNKIYETSSDTIKQLYSQVTKAVELLIFFFDDPLYVGRKYVNGEYEARFNRVLLEVEAYYFIQLLDNEGIKAFKEQFIHGFKKICEDHEFVETLVTSTKSMENYRIRYSRFQNLINEAFGMNMDINPFKRD